MFFVLIQLIPWTVLTVLVLSSYLRERSVEKKHMLWTMGAMMLGFMMSLTGPLLTRIFGFPGIFILKLFDIFHLFALYSILLLLTDFEASRRRQVNRMAVPFIIAGSLILVDPTSRQIAGDLITAAYDRGELSAGVMLFAMAAWGYVAFVFKRYGDNEQQAHIKKSTRYFSIACLFAVFSYAAAIIFYVFLDIKPAMIFARTLPIVAGFFMYLGARTPNLLASLHHIAERHQHLGLEKERLQNLSASTSLLDQLGNPQELLISIIQNATEHTGARAAVFTRWFAAEAQARIVHAAFAEEKEARQILQKANMVLEDLVIRPSNKKVHLLNEEPIESNSLHTAFLGSFPKHRCDEVQRLLHIERVVHHPLRANGTINGVLTFAFEDQRYDRSLVQVYCNQCEQTLRLIDFLEKTQQHSQDLQQTNRLMQDVQQARITRTMTFQDILDKILAALQRQLCSDFTGLCQIQKETYTVLAMHANDQHDEQRKWRCPVNGDLPAQRWLANSGFNRVIDESLFDSRGERLGFLAVAFKARHHPTKREQEILTFYANLLATEIERERQTRKLLASEGKYRGLFENALEGIFQVSVDGYFITANPALVEMLGYSHPEELFQVNLTDLFVEADDLQYMRQTLGEKAQLVGWTTRLRRADGLEVTVLASARTLKDEKEDRLFFEGVLQDITEWKKLESQLIRAQKMESIGTLASGVAHNFNNALSAILPMAELARHKPGNQELTQQCLKVIIEAAKHCTNLAGELLTLSKDRQLTKVAVSINPCVSTVVKLLQKTLPSDIVIESHLAPEVGRMNADASQIEQVIMNLVINARDAYLLSPDPENRFADKKITITTARCAPPQNLLLSNKGGALMASSWIRLSVSDQGVGMASEVVEHIFEPFYTTKSDGDGSGLGLATVYAIVQNHGGVIDVESHLGRGTRFDIYWPATSQPCQPQAQLAPGILRGRGHILVVDDQEKVRASLSQILDSLGYDCTLAKNGRDAIEVYAPDTHHAVLLDASMPGMDGPQTLVELRKCDQDVKVLLMSGFAKSGKIERALQDGACGFIRKPFNLAQISAALYELTHEIET